MPKVVQPHELPRADTADIVGTGERQARRIVGSNKACSSRRACAHHCSSHSTLPLASLGMPGLFPERVD